MILNRHFREFLELLVAHGVEFVVVGGHAVACHGHPRFTGGLDIFIAPAPVNARQIVQVYQAFGFGDLPRTESDFLDPDTIIEIGREPIKIQVLTGIDGVDFATCRQRAVPVAVGAQRFPVLGWDDLIANKLATGRPRDLQDVEALRAVRQHHGPAM